MAAVLLAVTLCLPFAPVSVFAAKKVQTVSVTVTAPEIGQNAGSVSATTTTEGTEYANVQMRINGVNAAMDSSECFRVGGVYAADVFVKADQLEGYVFTNTSKLIVNGRELKRKSFGGTGDTNVMAGTYYFDGLGSVPENYGYTEGVWRYDGRGWWFQYKDGTYPRNGWVFLPDSGGISEGRFYFDANGYLKTGWLLDPSDGNWYYLDPENGSILTDWHEINGKWYCFSWGAYGKKFGVMYCDERTPDGYTVDASGAWTGK